eukprot:239469-Pleurochrysis_carterae.AAC.4
MELVAKREAACYTLRPHIASRAKVAGGLGGGGGLERVGDEGRRAASEAEVGRALQEVSGTRATGGQLGHVSCLGGELSSLGRALISVDWRNYRRNVDDGVDDEVGDDVGLDTVEALAQLKRSTGVGGG